MRNSTPLEGPVLRYAADHSMAPGPVHRWIVAETDRRFPELVQMQIESHQGPLLAVLVELLAARRVLEVGTFTGLSSLWIAEALPADGRLVCCDVSEDYTSVARQAWERAGVADRIELHLAPALDTLARLNGTFDLAFLDADKENYPRYLPELIRLVRPGGAIVADNTLWYGRVVDDDDRSAETEGIRRFNADAAASPWLDVALLPMADGVSLMYRRSSQRS